jgi:hypothetical protein
LDCPQPKETMFKVPVPCPRLCLSFEFDIDRTKEDEVNHHPSTAKHDAACKQAALALSTLTGSGVPFSAFSAKAVSIDNDDNFDLQKAHNYPFDPAFHVDESGQQQPVVRYEFFYPTATTTTVPNTKMFMRIVPNLQRADAQ